MAVYYKWIKGCAPGATLDSGQWSYISWGTSAQNNSNALPTLKIKTGKNDANADTDIDLGYFLTNKVNAPDIENQWNFKKGIKLNSIAEITYSDSNILLNKNTKIDGNLITKDFEASGAASITGTLQVIGGTTLKDTLAVSKAATIGEKLTVNGETKLNNPLTVTSSCTATYFNATSDKRAKENIKLATYSALDIVKQLPVYNYNYKNSQETVVGILAQDLLKVQPKELNLVSNINATGENNDYMSIKEDKFMFILLKAIQEQEEEIKFLKQEIENLKKKI